MPLAAFPPPWSVEEQAYFVVRARQPIKGTAVHQAYLPKSRALTYEDFRMRKHRRTADDFVRDMKAKQQRSTTGDMEHKTSKGLIPEQAGAWRGNRGLTAWPVPTAAGRNRRSRRSVS
jgi:hypothetical protein